MGPQHQVTEILVTFSRALDSQEADQTGIYRLAHPGKKGSYTARNAVVVKLRSAVYDCGQSYRNAHPEKAVLANQTAAPTPD